MFNRITANLIRPHWHLSFLILILIAFYFPVIKGKIPLSADVITSKFYPLNTQGLESDRTPFNELTTDPVRQLYPWRYLAINQIKSGHAPWWNPYNLSSTPLIANFQSAVFYPGNLIFWLTDFPSGWTILIISQQLLGGLFLYFYLKHHRLTSIVSLFGSVTWIFSGFFIGWLEWNTLVHVAIWTPLILLSFDHLLSRNAPGSQSPRRETEFWIIILIVSLSSQFFAGSPAPWFYLSAFQIFYLVFLYSSQTLSKKIFPILVAYILFALIASPQFIATLQFASLSNRSFDIGNPLTDPTWFLPYRHLIQLLAPDFFGNPTAHNYFSVFNYTEFISYIGIIPTFFILYLVFTKKISRLSAFFITTSIFSVIMATKNPLSDLQVKFSIPLLSTSNASRWLIVTDLSLSILAVFGFDKFLSKPDRPSVFKSITTLFVILTVLWVVTFSAYFISSPVNQSTARYGLYLPTLQFIFIIITMFLFFNFSQIARGILSPSIKNADKSFYIGIILTVVSTITGLRFAQNYTSFSSVKDLYPPSQITSYLSGQPGYYRYMTLDKNIMPSAVNILYGLYTIEGYDSLYINDYGRLLTTTASQIPPKSSVFRRQPSLASYQSSIADLLGVKYILSFDSQSDDNLTLIIQEGFVNLYQNNQVLPRAFITKSLTIPDQSEVYPADIKIYQPNFIKITSTHHLAGYLVLSDSFYPGWEAILDGQKTAIINWNGLRATIVPEGNHELIYQYRYPQL